MKINGATPIIINTTYTSDELRPLNFYHLLHKR